MSMNPPNVNTYGDITLPDLQSFQSYLPNTFDDNLTLLQKVNMVIQTLTSMGVSVNSLFDNWNNVVIPYVTGTGLNNDVINQLTTWKNDGTLDSLINTNILGSLSNLKTNDKTSIVNAINENTSHLTDIMYSAKGLSTSDIQSLITSQPGQGTIYFPHTSNNIYTLSNTLLIPSNTKIVIANGVTLQMANGINKSLMQNSDQTNGNTNIQIIGGKFDMNVNNNVLNIPAINFKKVVSSYFKKMEVLATPTGSYTGNGAFHLEGDDNIIKDCQVHDSGDEGLVVNGMRNKVIRGKYYSNAYGSGVAIGGSYNTLENVWADGNTGSNFSLNGTYTRGINLLSTNGINNNGITLGHPSSPADYSILIKPILINNKNGISVANAKGVEIDGHKIIGNGLSTDPLGNATYGIITRTGSLNNNYHDGYVANYSSGIRTISDTITNNTIENCLSNGMNTYGVGNIVKNNIVRNNSGIGIYTQSTSTNGHYAYNQCYDNQTTPTQQRGIYANGMNDVIEHNICYGNVTTQLTSSPNANKLFRNLLSKTDLFVIKQTLTANSTSVTITNENLRPDSNINITPMTANAPSMGVFISNLNNGTMTLTYTTNTSDATVLVSIG